MHYVIDVYTPVGVHLGLMKLKVPSPFLKVFRKLLLTGGLATLLACNLPMNEKAPEPKPPETGFGESAKCLNQVPEAFEAFVNGKGKVTEITETWKCIDDVIAVFEDNTVGSNESHYTGREIANFLERYFLDADQKITDGLIEQVFQIKYALLGGSKTTISRQEIFEFRGLIPHFRDSMIVLNPHVNVYRLEWKPKAGNHPAFEEAMEKLAEVGALLGTDFKYNYDLRRLLPFSLELQKLYKNKRSLETVVDLAKKYSPVLASLRETINTKYGWKVFFHSGAKVFSEYAYYTYYMKGLKLQEGEGLERLDGLVMRSADLLNEFVLEKNKGVSVFKPEISLKEIEAIIPTLKDAELLPKKVSARVWKSLAKVAVERVLTEPAARIKGQPASGINTQSLQILRREFKMWALNQKVIEQIYQDRGETLPAAEILEKLRNPEVTENAEGIEELILIYDSPQALSSDSHGRLFIGEPDLPYRKKTSFLINIVRSGVRIITQACAKDLERIEKRLGVTEEEVHTCYMEVREFLNEMELVDPKSLDFAKSRFRDGSLFTNWSNGDTFLDFREGSHLILLILSGIEVDSFFFETLEKSCPIVKESELRYDWKVGLECTIESYKPVAPTYFESMPDMSNFLKAQTPEDYHLILHNFFIGAGVVVDAENMIKVSDLALFPHIVQYTENVYQLYDKNRDGIFDTAEAMLAFPTFQGILKTATNGAFTTERQLKGLFAWMLVYGAPPKKEEVGKFLLIWLPKGEAGWNVQADRKKLATILGIIGTAVAPPPPTK